jgi:hypothetical protein
MAPWHTIRRSTKPGRQPNRAREEFDRPAIYARRRSAKRAANHRQDTIGTASRRFAKAPRGRTAMVVAAQGERSSALFADATAAVRGSAPIGPSPPVVHLNPFLTYLYVIGI